MAKFVKEVVRQVMKDVAVDAAEQYSIEARFNRFLNRVELATITALINYRCHDLQQQAIQAGRATPVNPWLLEMLVSSEFGAEDLSEIKASNFEGVVCFLVDFSGLN